MNYYSLEIGYNGADVSDIATIVDVEEAKARWLIGVLQAGFEKQEIRSGFVNVKGQDSSTWVCFDRDHLISQESELPEPQTKAEAA